MGVGLVVRSASRERPCSCRSSARLPLAGPSLYPLAVLLGAVLVYGLAARHARLRLPRRLRGRDRDRRCGDSRRAEVRRVPSALADLGELAVFVALGLTIDLGFIFGDAALVAGSRARGRARRSSSDRSSSMPLLLPAELSRGERLFVMLGGLKGAVPILLASLAVVARRRSGQIYGIVLSWCSFGRRAGDACRRWRRGSGSPSEPCRMIRPRRGIHGRFGLAGRGKPSRFAAPGRASVGRRHRPRGRSAAGRGRRRARGRGSRRRLLRARKRAGAAPHLRRNVKSCSSV